MKRIILFTLTTVFLLSNIYAQVNLDSGLVTYYPFNGNTNDESGNGNNGTVFGATLTTDRFGNLNKAYAFDGNDYIKSNAGSLPTKERTTSLWFNATTLSTRPVLLGYGGAGSPGTSWWMNLNHGGTLAYFLGVHYTQSNYLRYFYTQEPIGEWINFVATTDSNGSKIYINGEEKSSNNFFINNTIVTGKDLSIGVNVSGNGIAPFKDNNIGYFNGKIDEVRIYNRALTAEEIGSLYNEIPTSIEILNPDFPDIFELSQNYPNPFNPTTKIKYQLPESGFVTLKVYDVLGNEITYLVNEEKFAGSYEIEFDASQLSSGIYFYKIQASDYFETKKMGYLK